MPLAGVFITELKHALSDAGRLMTGPEPESPRKPQYNVDDPLPFPI